jgi:hypothetical protein
MLVEVIALQKRFPAGTKYLEVLLLRLVDRFASVDCHAACKQMVQIHFSIW